MGQKKSLQIMDPITATRKKDQQIAWTLSDDIFDAV